MPQLTLDELVRIGTFEVELPRLSQLSGERKTVRCRPILHEEFFLGRRYVGMDAEELRAWLAQQPPEERERYVVEMAGLTRRIVELALEEPKLPEDPELRKSLLAKLGSDLAVIAQAILAHSGLSITLTPETSTSA